ncbi:MAG: mechanosensitive ion channel [Rhodocyclaceae bacterium]|nr:mechanosensitive ion channel [Rhodocyclaceae bacterium]
MLCALVVRWVRWMLASVLLVGLAGLVAAEPAAPLPSELEAAPVILHYRKVATLRAGMLGLTPAERATQAASELRRLADRGGRLVVTRRGIPQGQVVLVNGVMAMVLLAEDAPPGESIEDTAERVVAQVQSVLDSAHAGDSLPELLQGIALAVTMSAVALFLLWVLRRTRGWVAVRLARAASEKAENLKIGGEAVVQRERVIGMVRKVVTTVYWLSVLLVIYEWLSIGLEVFPYTRSWGDELHAFLFGILASVFGGIASGIPNLVVAFLILMLAKICVDLSKAFFDRLERGVVSVTWLDEDSVRPTRRLVSVAIWLFAVAMAYPYLPGAQTEAFRGLSVLVGLMISLGASSIVGQAASGLILMYTRTLRVGEYVAVGDAEGRVMELGIFSTRIRTGLGEELSVPNSLVLGNVTRNRSRSVEGDGYLVDSAVTIGYDTPWRQVHAMLLEAADRTRGIALNPAPVVYQTALSDFYAEYRLVCRSIPRDPGARPNLVSALNGHIQDVFNEYGVQIMSPHYIDDTPEPKVVPREGWTPPPAEPLPGQAAVENGQ